MKNAIFIALLLIMSYAIAQELQASVIGDKSAAGVNCMSGNQPNFFDFTVSVVNPSEESLKVSYEWYNSSSGTFISGGKICDVISGIGQSAAIPQCIVRLYSILGGTNKTEDINFNLIGTDGTNTWRKTLNITLRHYPSAYERNAMEKLNLAKEKLSELSNMLATCYNLTAETLLTNASSQLRDAGSYLEICNIAATLNLTNKAVNEIESVKNRINTTYFEQCKPKNDVPSLPTNVTNITTINETHADEEQKPPLFQNELFRFILILTIVGSAFYLIIYIARRARTPRVEKIELPKGSIVLIEGPVGSRKEEFCIRYLEDEIKKGNVAMVLSYESENIAARFAESAKKKVKFIKVDPDINEMGWQISGALKSRPDIIFFNILNLLLPKYREDKLSDFLDSTFKKLRNAGCTTLFTTEDCLAPKTLSTIESLFDGVIEFQVQEESGELNSYFRIKEFKLKKFDTNWMRFK